MRVDSSRARLALVVVLLASLAGSAHSSAGRRQAPSFEPNLGQAGGDARFVARGADLDLAITQRGAAISTRGGGCRETVRFSLDGADGSAVIAGEDPLPARSHYLRGRDPSRWTTGVPHFARVRCRAVLPGVDVIWHTAANGSIEHDFVLAPGIGPERLTLRFEGATLLRITQEGDLLIETPGGAELREQAPVAWQETAEGILPVVAAWVVRDGHAAGFTVGPHDPRRALVIDPVLSYSSYLGGLYDDEPQRIAVDPAGNLYVTGYTDSPDFPVASPLATYQDLADVFVTKLDAATGAPIYSTYLGGAGDDAAFGLAVDAAGSVVVVGETDSDDFPLVAALQAIYGGARDAFAAKLNPAGSALEYSSYIGGDAADTAYAVTFDGSGAVLIAGRTESMNFPVRAAFQPLFAGGFSDAFLAQVDASGALTYATFFGGSDDDEAFDVAVDSAGRPHLTGDTLSTDFPLSNARQPVLVGFGADAFVTRFATSGAALELSTYLGGSDDDWAAGIAVDAQGDILVGGTTFSGDFPIRGTLFGPSSGERGFVSKLRRDGSDFVYSTFFGGSGGETSVAFAGDGSGAAYLAGVTASDDLPLVFGVQPFPGGGVSDGFVARLDPSGARLSCSTYFGGGGQDAVIAVAAIDATHFWIAGWSDSSDLPTVSAFQPGYAGGVVDGFVARIGCVAAPGDIDNTLFVIKDAVSATDPIFTWTENAEAASYRLYAETDKATAFTTVAALGVSGVSGITLPSPAASLVFYRVSAGNCCGEGPR